MTYENMYKLLCYLKKNNITLKPEYLRRIAQSKFFTDKYYPILELDEELLKIYFDNDMNIHIADFFLIAKRKEVDTEKIKYFLGIVDKEPNKEKKIHILTACIMSIKKDNPKILEDVLSQNHGALATTKMIILLDLYSRSSQILENKLAMYYILKQPTEDDMRTMLSCASNPDILNNNFALKLISDAKTEAKTILKQAIEKVDFRENLFALYMIAKQPSIKRMQIMFRACEEELAVSNPENLLLLDSMETEEDMELYCGLLAYTQVRGDLLLKNHLVYNDPKVLSTNLENVDKLLTRDDFTDVEKLEQIAQQTTVAASNAVLDAYRNITKANASKLKKNKVNEENIKFLMDLKALEEKKLKEERELTQSLKTSLVTGENENYLELYGNSQILRRIRYQDINLEKYEKHEEEAE